MKVFRKVMVSLLLVLTAALSSVWFFACGKSADGVEPLVIEADESAAGKTLLQVMSEKEEDGEFSYKIKDGMIVEINGTENDLDYNPCWMLYTSDQENSNTAWGEYEYNGETLGSASVGADSLIVKSGEVYVWVYQEF
jgi:hypothetical protein